MSTTYIQYERDIATLFYVYSLVIAIVDSNKTVKDLSEANIAPLRKNRYMTGYIVYRQLAELHEKNEYLILLPKGEQFWTIPKGVILSGENATSAANRMLKEQANLTDYQLEPITEFGTVIELGSNNSAANITILGGMISNPTLPIIISETFHDYQWMHIKMAYSIIDDLSRIVLDTVKYFTRTVADHTNHRGKTFKHTYSASQI